jgi:hypothetical protein
LPKPRKDKQVSERKRVYAEEYLAAHNRELERHPKYRADMKFTQVLPNGSLVQMTRDPVIAAEDNQVFDQVCKTVAQSYDLIIP